MKEVCHAWQFSSLLFNFIHLPVTVLANEVQILLGVKQKFVKKLPLFGKIFIHPWIKLGTFFRFSLFYLMVFKEG